VKVIGIDPGKRGGIAVLSLLGEVLRLEKMPENLNELIEFLESERNGLLRVFLERQQPMPKQGVISMFNLGKHYGEIRGVLIAMNISFEEVVIQRWKREFGLNGRGLKRKERKKKAVERACELFPEVRGTVKKHDGLAEALLIAEYGRRLLAGRGEIKVEKKRKIEELKKFEVYMEDEDGTLVKIV